MSTNFIEDKVNIIVQGEYDMNKIKREVENNRSVLDAVDDWHDIFS